MIHISVLLEESIDGLEIKSGEIFIDGTLGGGGHTEEVIRRLKDSVTIYTIDADKEAIERSRERLGNPAHVTFLQGNFRDIEKLLQEKNLEHVDKVLLDIGLSSNQLEDSGRGFSFKKDEPLDMRFDETQDLSAETIVNNWDEETLRTIIRAWGEERWAGRIARAIVRTRELTPIKTTTELADIITAAVPRYYARQRLHPATRTFQAIRIAVNDELGALVAGIEGAFRMLRSGGRLAVISFHSLEDRIVKDHFKAYEETKLGTRITKKPIVPSAREMEQNPRSRSAKLRIFEKK